MGYGGSQPLQTIHFENPDITNLTTQLAQKAQQTEPIFNSTTLSESALLGAELTSASGWTSTGWTGDYNTGFTHTSGNTNPLTFPLSNTGTNLYQVSFSVSTAVNANDFTVSVGNSPTFDPYNGTGAGSTYTFGAQSVSNGNLVITPASTFVGKISNISVKQITGIANPSMVLKDSQSNNSLEMRLSKQTLQNKFIGKNAGQYNTTGYANVVLGDLSLTMNTTGFWNVAVGVEALELNTTGSRNTAIGFYALRENTIGQRNAAIGSYALTRNKTGLRNEAMGSDSLFYNTSGSYNVAIGGASQYSNDSGSNNIALGESALYTNVSGSDNVAIGQYALQRVTVSENVGVGKFSMYGLTTGIENTGLGTGSLQRNVTGQGNVGVGYVAGYGVAGATYNYNTLIGDRAGYGLNTGGDSNTLIGYKAGMSITTGSKNIIIGQNLDAPTPTTSNYLNIGGTLKGDTFNKRIGIDTIDTPTAKLHLPAGGASANSAPLKLTSGTVLATPEAGAIEFDGTNLYFTTSGGVRKTITAS